MSTELWGAQALISRETFLLVSWCGFCVATIGVIERIAVRLIVFKKLAVDDLFVFLAWLSSCAFAIVWHIKSQNLYNSIPYMIGEKEVGPAFFQVVYDYITGQEAVLICQIIGLWSIKYSFLFFFRTIGQQLRQQKIIWWTVFAYVTASLAVNLGMMPWGCYTNNRSDVVRVMVKCSTPELGQFTMIGLKVSTTVDITSDVAILIIPFTILWQVRLSLQKKLALGSLFALTLFIILCALLRCIIVENTAVATYVDVTWLYLWHKIELDTAIVVACLASFRALFTSQRHRRTISNPIQDIPAPIYGYETPERSAWVSSEKTSESNTLTSVKGVHVKNDIHVKQDGSTSSVSSV